ncbi:alcohol dehydrogenase [NADP(+)]-like, partial [Limulus polyphemus]|uniref:Alcohol dehydrogenase [NADP(+)]-like n=1 Tax=Limulus polyphemus TaxID=6850 RepID=A0ABM1TDK5_LIMPO
MSSFPYFVKLNTGSRMPFIGIDTVLMEPHEVSYLLKSGISVGYRLIETVYAHNNAAEIGKVLGAIMRSGKLERADLFIITKLPIRDHRREMVKYFLKESLDRLQLTYVDLLLLHYPANDEECNEDSTTPGGFVDISQDDLFQTWKGMEDAFQIGMAKAIGLSNFNLKQIQLIRQNGRIKPANVQVECHAYLSQSSFYEYCARQNITFTAYLPLGSVDANSEFSKNVNENQKPTNDKVLVPLCLKYRKTAEQILLRWLIQRGIVVISRSVRIQKLKEHFR